MNLLEYIKNKIRGFKANTYFEDYYMHVSDTIFLRSLEADFEKLKSVSDESRRILAENHQAKFEMLTPKEFANLTSSSGDYSMLLEVLFENTMELDQFIGELQHFGRTKTLIVFSTSVEHRGVKLS